MTHLADGQLHAYLDGQLAAERPALERHLAECAECRARLEAARHLRERARAVLHATGPANTAAPPFEQVLRRARGQQRRARTPVPVMLAWAASLAVAVTAGWYARSLLPAGHAAPPVTRLAHAPTVEAQPPAQVAEARPPAQVQQAQRPAQVAQARPAGAARQAPATGAVDTQPPSSTAVTVAAPIATPQSGAAGAVGEQADVANAQAAVAEKAVGARAPAPTASAARLAAPTSRLEEVVVTGTGATAPAWTTVSRPVAEERLGVRIATIPDLPLLGFAVSGSGPNTVVRTIQVLGTGATIELYERRAGAKARGTALATADTTRATSVTVDRQGYLVTGTARVPADSLRKLLARLEGR